MAESTVLTSARIATMDEGIAYGLIDNGAVAITSGRIAWVGDAGELPSRFSKWKRRNLRGRLVTPGLIDCHTHIVFAGHRAREFEMRLNGATYAEVARAGGGINSTVEATRRASADELLEQSLPRVDAMLAEGVTTLEIKSGYGLEVAAEINMLRAARKIAKARNVDIATSFLGAHAIPPEYKGRPDAYLAEVCLPALDAAHKAKLVDAVDGFCEGIAFGPQQIEKVFTRAKALRLPVKLHAEQLSNLGGAALAARFGALSADHLEYLDQAGIDAMRVAGSVAVILPGAFYTLREKQLPPIEALRASRVPMAISTDCNPGTSPMTSLLLAMNMGCTLFRMTPEEVLRGVTCHAARALGFKDRGIVAAGKKADLAIWNAGHPAELSYRIGFNPLYRRIKGGNW